MPLSGDWWTSQLVVITGGPVNLSTIYLSVGCIALLSFTETTNVNILSPSSKAIHT